AGREPSGVRIEMEDLLSRVLDARAERPPRLRLGRTFRLLAHLLSGCGRDTYGCLGESTGSRTAIREDLVENDDDRDSVKGDEPVLRPVHASLIQYFENAGSVSVESTLVMPWPFVTTASRRFSRGSALMRATMRESPVVRMISWISGSFFNALMVFCVSVDRMRRYALLACPSFLF